MPRIAVIGAGIVGAAIAFRLAEKQADVIVLDRAAPGSGTTSASYAWINANEKLPRDYYDLSVAAMVEHQRLAWRLAPAHWYHRDGNLIWSSDIAMLRERVARLRSWGYAAEMIPVSQAIADLAPGLAGGSVADGGEIAWFAEEAWVDAPVMTDALIEAARHVGGRILSGPEREVVGIDLAVGRVASVTLRGGQTLPVDAVVNAAGPSGAAVAALVGRELPMRSSPGFILRAHWPEVATLLPRPVESDAVALRPDGADRILAALDIDDVAELAGVAPGALPLDTPLVARVMALCSEVAPEMAAAAPLQAVVAMRPMPADGFPSVGSVPEIPGYFEAVMHSGVTLAALVGRAMTEEVLGRGDAFTALLAPFRPDRFSVAAGTAAPPPGTDQ